MSCLVISLDLEMMWGNLDGWTVDGYGWTNVAHVREVVDRLIRLFEQYEVKATFAVVGIIMEDGDGSENNDLYYAPDVIEMLKSSKWVEIGTHTYSHYSGNDRRSFEADLKKAVERAREKGIEVKSFVFPKNQVREEFLDICRKYGIKAYRGNPARFYEAITKMGELLNRLCRFLDSYFVLSGMNSYSLEEKGTGLQNVPASRFLRPYSRRLAFLEGLRFRRIRKEMEYAARHNEVYHLWWHPHNFGANMEENFAFLEKILKYFQRLQRKYGMRSMTMCEIYEEVKGKR